MSFRKASSLGQLSQIIVNALSVEIGNQRNLPFDPTSSRATFGHSVVSVM